MARPGRKPEPTTLKLLRGNPGKRPINKGEPKLAATVLRPPAHLDAVAKTEWRRVAKMLAESVKTTALDRAVLTCYCEWWSQLVRLSTELRKVGPIIVSKTTKQPYMSPWLAGMAMASKQVERFAGELGMSPSSRSRIDVGGPGDAGDELDDFNKEPKRGCVG